ncbi:MAG: hypothetical protein R3C26_08390 [Calditrichia bacterium]
MNVAHLVEPVPPGDWQTIGLAFVGIMLLIGASEGLRRSLGCRKNSPGNLCIFWLA